MLRKYLSLKNFTKDEEYVSQQDYILLGRTKQHPFQGKPTYMAEFNS